MSCQRICSNRANASTISWRRSDELIRNGFLPTVLLGGNNANFCYEGRFTRSNFDCFVCWMFRRTPSRGQSRTKSTRFLSLVFFRPSLQLPLWNFLLKNPPSITTIWKATVMSQASHFCRKLKRKNRVFSALCLPHLNNLFCPIHYLQSAYRPTQRTALFKVVNDILRALDNGNVPVLTLLDLSSMYHQILFSRLGTLNGISCTALS